MARADTELALAGILDGILVAAACNLKNTIDERKKWRARGIDQNVRQLSIDLERYLQSMERDK